PPGMAVRFHRRVERDLEGDRSRQGQTVDDLGLQTRTHLNGAPVRRSVTRLLGGQLILAGRDAGDLEESLLVGLGVERSFLELIEDSQVVFRGADGRKLQAAFGGRRPAFGGLHPTRNGGSAPQLQLSQAGRLAGGYFDAPKVNGCESP